jgi:trehalose 6-phosphate phosphatase
MSIPCLLDSLLDITDTLDRSSQVLVGLDFDGTLTAIGPRPDEVTLSQPVRSVLDQLSQIDRVTVMIVSGRRLDDVAGRVGLPRLIYAGNHGMEIRGPGLSFVEPTAVERSGRLERLTSALGQRLAQVAGVLVEPKGLTTSVHFRNVSVESRDQLARLVRKIVASDANDFILTSGLCVWEIRPRTSWNKGEALRWMMKRLGRCDNPIVFYLGDDRTDEDVFDRLTDAVTVKIGDRTVPTQARYWLPDSESVLAFLHWLLESSPLKARFGRKDH